MRDYILDKISGIIKSISIIETKIYFNTKDNFIWTVGNFNILMLHEYAFYSMHSSVLAYYKCGLKKRSSGRRRRADSRLPLRSSTYSYDKISYGCPVVLGRTAESLKANEFAARGGFVDNGDTIASEFETR